MLMTPMRPNTIASPSAIRSRIEASEAPWKSVSTVVVRRLHRWSRRIACVAAPRPARGAGGLAARAGRGRRVGALVSLTVRQPDKPERLGERVAHPAIGLFLERFLDGRHGRQVGLVAELHGGTPSP